MATFLIPTDFVLVDDGDFTKLVTIDAASLQTGTTTTLYMPDYGGGVVPMTPDQGTANDCLVSGGVGANPGWQTRVGPAGTLTAGRLAIVAGAATIQDDEDLTWTAASNTLNLPNLNVTSSYNIVCYGDEVVCYDDEVVFT